MTSDTASADPTLTPEEDLAQLGYTQQLNRRGIGSLGSFALGVSMISFTTTVFTLFSTPFQALGGYAIWLWVPVLGGVLLVAMVFGHLAARLPAAGYAYQWSGRLVSPGYGWLTGWNALLCTLIGTAGIAVALATVFAPDFWNNPTQHDVELLAAIVTVAAWIINTLGVKVAAVVNNVGAAVELIGTLGFTVVLAFGLFFFHHVQGTGVLTQVGSSNGTRLGVGAIGAALLLPVYTLEGWEGSADLAEETTDPKAIAPKSMIRSVAVSGVAAFFVFAIFAMAIPGAIGPVVNGSQNPLVAVFQAHFGTVPADALQAIAFTAMFSALLANMTCAGRTGFSLARDGMLPFSRAWGAVNSRTRTPIYTMAVVAVVAIGVNFLASGIATNVIGTVNIAVYLTYGSTCVAVLIAHRRGTIPAGSARYFSLGRWLVPVTVTCLVFCAIVIAFTVVPASSHSIVRYAAGAEVLGVIWYFAALRRKLRAGEAGPGTSVHAPAPAPAL